MGEPNANGQYCIAEWRAPRQERSPLFIRAKCENVDRGQSFAVELVATDGTQMELLLVVESILKKNGPS